MAVRRRDFVKAIIGSATGWPLAARAQPEKLPIIGFLGPLSLSAETKWTAAFVQRMREHGWIEGRTVVIEYRWAEGRSERFAEIAAEFVRLKVDVIVTAATAAVIALKQATSVIPIVFAVAGDPVGTGLVASLARPGGNVTGLSNQSADIASKRLDLLREVVPNLHRLAIMATGGPIGVLEMGEVQAAARTLGLEVVPAEIRRAEDIAPTIEALKGRADALYVVTEPLVNTNRVRLNTVALGRAIADDAWYAGLRRSGRSHGLWSKLSAPMASSSRLRRQNFARGEAGRPPSRAADEVRSHHQLDDRKGARADDSGVVPAARRRGDRVNGGMSAIGT
jgi:ABC-type uncharacterized transport system substrate-binding protein